MSNLDNEVARYVAGGWSVESRTETQATLVKRSRIGWFWNILLTLLTGGLWLIVVFFKLVNRKAERVVLTLDEFGSLSRR